MSSLTYPLRRSSRLRSLRIVFALFLASISIVQLGGAGSSRAVACSGMDDCPRERGWFVRICRGQTKASGVRLDVGLGGVGDSHRYWRDWSPGQEFDFNLPVDLLHAKEIWLRGESHNGEDVSLCLFFNDHATQAYEFDEDEDHEKSRGDNHNEECDCL